MLLSHIIGLNCWRYWQRSNIWTSKIWPSFGGYNKGFLELLTIRLIHLKQKICPFKSFFFYKIILWTTLTVHSTYLHIHTRAFPLLMLKHTINDKSLQQISFLNKGQKEQNPNQREKERVREVAGIWKAN